MKHIHLDTIDSTNDQARRALADTALPFALSATTQTAGRGGRGRTWTSPPGGIWLTLARHTRRPTRDTPALTLAVAVAALSRLTSDYPALASRILIRWPNDLLLDQRKLAGILCERLRTTPHDTVICGIGINANISPDDLPPDLRTPATSLKAALDTSIDISSLTRRLIADLDHALTRFEADGLDKPLLESVNRNLAWINRDVTIRHPDDTTIIATLRGVTSTGAALITTHTGEHTLNSAEIEALRPNA